MALINYLHTFILGIAVLVIGEQCFAGDSASEWAAVAAPTSTLAGQSIGEYAAGCIGGAVALPLSGSGYQVMRVSRNRIYGHEELIRFVQRLGEAVADEKLGSLLIGDLGQPRGGPAPTGHRSHQSGLDVDIWFLLLTQANDRLLTEVERESWSAPSVLDAGSDRLDARQWSDTHEKVLRLAAAQPEVDRIFVNPSIKRELCKRKSGAAATWLRKIRPWWKHDDHFHVRLKCPDDSSYCKNQDPLPEGDGCDAGLEWWFSEEAKHPAKKPLTPLKLPALCDKVINGEAAEK